MKIPDAFYDNAFYDWFERHGIDPGMVYITLFVAACLTVSLTIAGIAGIARNML